VSFLFGGEEMGDYFIIIHETGRLWQLSQQLFFGLATQDGAVDTT